jgi:hypothetical protein
MTLKQMVDNHMIIQFRDKDKNYCDENSSKVEVTKISDSEYALKVVLNCGDQKDYILDTIGCTTVCSNGTCQTVINNNGIANGKLTDGLILKAKMSQIKTYGFKLFHTLKTSGTAFQK